MMGFESKQWALVRKKSTGKCHLLSKKQCVPLKFRVLLKEEGEKEYWDRQVAFSAIVNKN